MNRSYRTLDQREIKRAGYKSHIAHLSVQYKKYRTLKCAIICFMNKPALIPAINCINILFDHTLTQCGAYIHAV